MNPYDHPGYVGIRALMLALFGPSGTPPAWRADAACTGEDAELFFTTDTTAQALDVCAGCPVIDQCRADHLEWESRTRSRRFYASGVVAGTTGSERNQTYYPRTTTRKEVA
ncbi:WhiB family transcriptional regulator [Lentzea jiangxiensis]|uniref:WhiB family transcriptional regulator, redox-sensing transcriptional regulator n=1 Tax=Lentzea jiangxiensis TaxID=641025 RepID=A0A1H0U489_9PSEU|nr:WhiB family transcriptional regulator [Lentzea jiangxiensis]SDP60805.1 WhiB family transcriptional regulator, redox-sensing transcriptional regulator [Lentzea jiangxiensis]